MKAGDAGKQLARNDGRVQLTDDVVNKYFRHILKNSSNDIIGLDRNGIIVFYSERLARDIGVKSQDALIGRHFTEMYRLFADEAFIENAKRAFQHIQASGEPIHEELAMDFSGTGKARSYIVQSIPLFDENGVFDGAQVVFSDTANLIISRADRKIRVLLEHLPMCCMLMDANGNILDCNQEAMRLFGVSDKKEFIRLFPSLFPDVQPNGKISSVRIRERLKAAVEGDDQRFEWLFRTVSGAPLPVEATFVRVPWEGDYNIAGYFRDLRESKAQEEKAREVERRLQAMFDATPLCVSIWNNRLEALDCNQEVVRLLGAPGKSWVLRHFVDDLWPAFQPDGEASRKKAAKILRLTLDNGWHRDEWTYRTIKGDLIPTAAVFVRVPWRGDYYVAAYCRDLREIRKKEHEAEEANERTRIMLDSMIICCIFFDEEGNVLDCNERTVLAFGCEDKRDVIENFYRFSPEYQPDGMPSEKKTREMIRYAYEKGQVSFLWDHITASGDPLPVEVWLRRVKWRDNWRIISSMRDLSDVRQIQESNIELEVAKRAAQAASEAKSDFLASMSHEIRTPMNAIIGLTDLMRADNLDEEQTQYLHDLRSMSSVLLQIINDILDLSKIEAGKMELVPCNYSIRELYDRVCSLTHVTAKEKPITFRHEIASDLPDILYGDEVRVQQIIFNILNNAVKYTHEGYVDLRIGREMRGDLPYLSITVRDTGVGIREQDIPRLFEKFTQFDVQKNRKIAGTGLGLPITRQLVDMMKGEIAVTSEYGRGSVFSVRLPLVEGDPSQMAHQDTLSRRVMAREDTRVLVVDDSPINMTVALGYLARHGIEADKAESGVAALAMVQAKSYDLVFMDHMMPEMDGIEAARRIRSLEGEGFRALPIIALSANAVAGMREVFLAAGMNDFITKPIDPKELNRVLMTWLPRKKLFFPATAPMRPEEGRAAAKSEDVAVLDRAAGLANLQGDEASYREILASFQRIHGGDAESATAMLAQDDARGARRVAHTLKSSAATIGATRLSRAAAEAEKRLAEGNAGREAEEGALETMREELALVSDALARLLPEQHNGEEKALPLDREKARALLDRLEPLLAKGSVECLALSDEIAATLSPLDGVYREFATLLDDLDFSRAWEMVPALRRALGD